MHILNIIYIRWEVSYFNFSIDWPRTNMISLWKIGLDSSLFIYLRKGFVSINNEQMFWWNVMILRILLLFNTKSIINSVVDGKSSTKPNKSTHANNKLLSIYFCSKYLAHLVVAIKGDKLEQQPSKMKTEEEMSKCHM